MAVLGKLGEKLRNTRETKGYSIREVSEQTHITPKYVEALENEDYSVFPSETYVVGFLRTYAEFLGLDPQEIIREYKGLKVQISETPVEQLTEVTKPTFQFQFEEVLKTISILLLVFFTGFGIYWSWSYFKNFLDEKKTFMEKPKPCLEREKKTLTIQENEPFLSLLDITSAYLLSIKGESNILMCIEQVEELKDPKNLRLDFYYQNEKSQIESLLGETIILSNVIPALHQSSLKIEISIKEIYEKSVQIEIIAKPKSLISNKSISVVLEIIQDTYLEWVSDGKNYRGIFLKQGDIRILEANTRLDIKIGNGAGVKYHRGNLPPKIAGPPGKIVKLSFRKIQDPLDPTQFRIEETVRIAR